MRKHVYLHTDEQGKATRYWFVEGWDHETAQKMGFSYEMTPRETVREDYESDEAFNKAHPEAAANESLDWHYSFTSGSCSFDWWGTEGDDNVLTFIEQELQETLGGSVSSYDPEFWAERLVKQTKNRDVRAWLRRNPDAVYKARLCEVLEARTCGDVVVAKFATDEAGEAKTLVLGDVDITDRKPPKRGHPSSEAPVPVFNNALSTAMDNVGVKE